MKTRSPQFWDSIAKVYEDTFMDLHLYDDTYDYFNALLPNNKASLLEIGCGPGNITRYLTQKKPTLNFLATDSSAEMLEIAKKNIPTASFKQLNAKHISSIDDVFNGIISGFIIPYLTTDECEKFIKDCSKLLTLEGILYISYIADSPKILNQSDVHYYSTGDITSMLNKASFILVKEFVKEYTKSNGTSENHVIIIARKTSV